MNEDMFSIYKLVPQNEKEKKNEKMQLYRMQNVVTLYSIWPRTKIQSKFGYFSFTKHHRPQPKNRIGIIRTEEMITYIKKKNNNLQEVKSISVW